MAREVWKLGKFDKGINSHTDPKDIKDSEWVELDDVNISKIGIARPQGMPRVDTSVHQLFGHKVIPGDGLYRFNSDNSYMSSDPNMSRSTLVNTQDGGGGKHSTLFFNIKSLAWVFPTSGNVDTIGIDGYCKFQLFMKYGHTGGTSNYQDGYLYPITDEFIVYYSEAGSTDFYTVVQPYHNQNSYFNNKLEVNVMANYPTSGANSAFGFEFDYANWGDYGTGALTVFNTNEIGAATNSGMCQRVLLNDNTSDSWQGDPGGSINRDWFTNGHGQFSSNQINNGAGIELETSQSDLFWDPHSGALDNLNDGNIIFSAKYESGTAGNDGYPIGTLDYLTHKMMGFYKWDGYLSNLNNSNDSNPVGGTSWSDFVIPFEPLAPGGHMWRADYFGLYGSYYTGRYSFMARLIRAINEYSVNFGSNVVVDGGFTNANVSANWTLTDCTATVGTHYGSAKVCEIVVSGSGTTDTVFIKQDDILVADTTYQISFEYYIPSTNTNVNALDLRVTGDYNDAPVDMSSVTDAWTSHSVSYHAPADGTHDNIYIYLQNTTTGNNTLTVGDKIYVKNIQARPVGAETSEYSKFYARWFEDGNEWQLEDYDEALLTPPADYNDDSWHTSNEYWDTIFLYDREKASQSSTDSIQCKMTYYNTSGNSIGSILDTTDTNTSYVNENGYNGGEAGSTGILEEVHLLDDRDRYGQGAGGSNIISYTDENGNELLSDVNITSSGPYGGAMVIEGDTQLEEGSDEYLPETWRITVQGYPGSSQILSLKFYSTNSSHEVTEIEIEANYPEKHGNQQICISIMNTILSHELLLSYYTVDIGSMELVEGTENFSYPDYQMDIKAQEVGINGQFTIEQSWRESDNQTNSYSIGVDDEQIVFMGKGQKEYLVGNYNLRSAFFKLYSSFSSSWISYYNSSSWIGSIDEGNMNKYLNWWYFDGELNSPLFYDEGNVLRIIETNFSLKQKLEYIFNENSILDNINNDFYGYMWANPNQWIGYKDISNHFGDAFNYSYATVGFFIGHQAKIWNYTYESNDELFGIRADSDASGTGSSTSNNFNEAEKAFMQFYFTSNSTGGVDWTGHIKIYAAACYDDGSESLPQHYFSNAKTGEAGYFDNEDSDGNTNTKLFRMQVLFKPQNADGTFAFPDVRINGIRLYYTHSEESHSTFWNLGKFDFNRGYLRAATIDITDSTSGVDVKHTWKKANAATHDGTVFNGSLTDETITVHNGETYRIEYPEMPKTKSFEDINGYSPYANTLYVDYKAACIAGRRTFVGNIRVWNGNHYEYYNDRMVVSPINALDTFPYPDNVLDLDISDGDEIIALTVYGDKIIQFKKRICYIMNISTGIASEFFIEERHKWKGILNKNHFCVTDEGIFWVNDRGAWIYDGEEVKDLFISGDENESQQIINKDEWNSFLSESSIVGYDANTRQVMIVKNRTYNAAGDADSFMYSLIVKGWSKGKKRFYPGDNASITNFQNTGEVGKLCYLSEEFNNGGGPDEPGAIH